MPSQRTASMRNVPADPDLYTEALALGDDPMFDFQNLGVEDTGITGFITITSMMGSRGPRVRYRKSLMEGSTSFSVSISATPEVISASMEQREIDRVKIKVKTWVVLNRQDLCRYWEHGWRMDVDEVRSLVDRLMKV